MASYNEILVQQSIKNANAVIQAAQSVAKADKRPVTAPPEEQTAEPVQTVK